MASTADEAPLEARRTRDKDEGCGYRRPTPCFFTFFCFGGTMGNLLGQLQSGAPSE